MAYHGSRRRVFHAAVLLNLDAAHRVRHNCHYLRTRGSRRILHAEQRSASDSVLVPDRFLRSFELVGFQCQDPLFAQFLHEHSFAHVIPFSLFRKVTTL